MQINFTPKCYRDHEWVKHGSCALVIDSMSNEYNFFSTTLKLHEEHNITIMLEKHGIKPSYDHHYKVCKELIIYENIIYVYPFPQHVLAYGYAD